MFAKHYPLTPCRSMDFCVTGRLDVLAHRWLRSLCAVQSQEAELKGVTEKLAQATAKALQLEQDLQEACRQLAILAEDDQDLRDKVSLFSIVVPH